MWQFVCGLIISIGFIIAEEPTTKQQNITNEVSNISKRYIITIPQYNSLLYTNSQVLPRQQFLFDNSQNLINYINSLRSRPPPYGVPQSYYILQNNLAPQYPTQNVIPQIQRNIVPAGPQGILPQRILQQQIIPQQLIQQQVLPQQVVQGLLPQTQGFQQIIQQQAPPQQVIQGVLPQTQGFQQIIQQQAPFQQVVQGVSPQTQGVQHVIQQQASPQRVQGIIPHKQGEQVIIPQRSGIPQQILPQRILQQVVQQRVIPNQKLVQQQVVPQQIVPPQILSQRIAPQPILAQQVIPQRVAPALVIPQQIVPQKVISQKVVPQRTQNIIPNFQLQGIAPPIQNNLIPILAQQQLGPFPFPDPVPLSLQYPFYQPEPPRPQVSLNKEPYPYEIPPGQRKLPLATGKQVPIQVKPSQLVYPNAVNQNLIYNPGTTPYLQQGPINYQPLYLNPYLQLPPSGPEQVVRIGYGHPQHLNQEGIQNSQQNPLYHQYHTAYINPNVPGNTEQQVVRIGYGPPHFNNEVTQEQSDNGPQQIKLDIPYAEHQNGDGGYQYENNGRSTRTLNELNNGQFEQKEAKAIKS